MSAAYWCMLAGALLPYVTVGIAKALGTYDNANPRKSENYSGMALRAQSAHYNAFESFPLFAVAVLVASAGSAHLANATLDTLAIAWLVLRLVYIAAYLLDRATARSVIWTAAHVVAIVIFTMPAGRA
jgi:uncharacterized MAPEG superfamily protein